MQCQECLGSYCGRETVQIARTRRNLVDLAKRRKHALRDYAQEIRKYVGRI